MSKRYVLFAATGVGLGHLLSAVIRTAYFAWRTGRVLALDMREVHFFANNNHAAFFDNFGLRFPVDLEIVTDLAVIDELRRDPDLHYLRLEDRLLSNDPFTNKVLMVPCIAPGSQFRPNFERSEKPFHLDLRGPLLEALDKTQAMPQWQGRVIGLHYRATIGELFDRMTKLTVPDYDERYAKIMDEYVATALRLVEGAPSDSYSFLIASDDRTFIKEMKERLPNSFSLSTKLLDREFAAYVRENNFDISILMDAVVDMWCLSRCDQFIHSRSGFSEFAILNSPTLDESNVHFVHMPLFNEILDSVDPETAVEWARAAARKVEISRMHYYKNHQAWLRALERAGRGDGAEAEAVRQRIQWHWEVNDSPEIDNPNVFDARALERDKRDDVLLERLQGALAQFPGNPFFLSGYGGTVVDRLTKLGRYDEALEPARRAVALAPGDPFLHQALGAALIRAGYVTGAETSLRKAIKLDPDIGAFHVDLADCLSRLGRIDEALATGLRAAELSPEDPLPQARIGEAHMNAQRYPEAEAAFRKATELNPRSPGHFHQLSIALERQGRYEDAIAASEQGALADPRQLWSLERAATLCLMIGKPAKAERLARKILVNQPDHARAQKLLNDALHRQNAEPEAAMTEQPADPQQYLQSAISAIQAEDYAAAETAISEAIALRPDNPGFYHVLGIALERQKKMGQAIEAAQKAVDLDSNDLGRTYRVANLRMIDERFEEALEYLEAARRLHPSSARLNDLLGDTFVKLERVHEALAAAQEAARLESSADRDLRVLELTRRAGNRGNGSGAGSSFAPFVRPDRVMAGGSKKVAVLVRSHKCSPKYHDLMNKLSSDDTAFDLYGIIDTTNGAPDTGKWPAVLHSVPECRDLGLTQRRPGLLYHCGDFPLYFALRDLPDYDFYIMIEDDVDLVDGGPTFINEICEIISRPASPPFGLAGIQFMNGADFPSSSWYDGNRSAAAKLVGEGNVCYTTFPIMVVSKPLVALMFSQRQLEAARGTGDDDIVNCEVYAASIAKGAGFGTFDLREMMPGCYEPRTMMMHTQYAGYGRPLGYNLEKPGKIRILHPIYDETEFLARLKTRYVQARHPGADDVLRTVEEESDRHIRPQLKEEVRRLLGGVT